MQFTFYDNPSTSIEVVGTGWGYATKRVAAPDDFGFFVDLDAKQAALGWVDFTIPELRQMLAEAEELRDRDTGNGCSACDCNACMCETLAPLASPDEMDQEFQSRDLTDDRLTVRRQLELADQALGAGDSVSAQTHLSLAHTIRELFG